MAMARVLQRVGRAAARFSATSLTWNGSAGMTHATPCALVCVQMRERSTRTSSSLLAIASAAAAMAVVATTSLCEASDAPAEGGYKENPLQHVAALLRLYDEIDRNMEVLANRMLESLQKRVEKEKSENDGKLSLTPEQIALHMSIEFESTLENVQDAVFRNNYVTKDQVREALQRLTRGELRGSGAQGKLTVQEAEAIEGYVKRLERLRWKVTGSRESLLPTQHKALVKQAKPEIPLETVVKVMETLIPTLTTEMETIARDVRSAHSDLSPAQQHQRIAAAYVKRSGELTEQLCRKQKLDVRAFQAALIYYHDDPVFEKALARLSAEQQRRFAAIGL